MGGEGERVGRWRRYMYMDGLVTLCDNLSDAPALLVTIM